MMSLDQVKLVWGIFMKCKITETRIAALMCELLLALISMAVS